MDWTQLCEDLVDRIVGLVEPGDYVAIARAGSEPLLRAVVRRIAQGAGFPFRATLGTRQTDAVVRFVLGQNLFLTGLGGSGKSFVVQAVVGIALQAYGSKCVAVAASTSAAANQLMSDHIQATTLHQLLGAERTIDDSTGEASYDTSFRRTGALRHLRLVIVDEVSMTSERMFNALAEALHPGCQLLATGDLLQLPPVDVDAGHVFHSAVFRRLHPVELVANRRAAGGSPTAACFRRVLERLRLGEATDDDERWLREQATLHRVDDVALFGTNAKCAEWNRAHFERLDTPVVEYAAVDHLVTKQWVRVDRTPPQQQTTGQGGGDAPIYDEVEASLDEMEVARRLVGTSAQTAREAGMRAPPLTHKELAVLADKSATLDREATPSIPLRCGARVVLTRARWEAEDESRADDAAQDTALRVRAVRRRLLAANGEVGTVRECHEGGVLVEFPPRRSDGAPRMVHVGMVVYEHGCARCPRTLRQRVYARRQLPLALGYARTVHKAQGTTLAQPTYVDLVNVECMGRPRHSLIYTTISRATAIEQLCFRRNRIGRIFQVRHAVPDPAALAFHTDRVATYRPLGVTLRTLGVDDARD